LSLNEGKVDSTESIYKLHLRKVGLIQFQTFVLANSRLANRHLKDWQETNKLLKPINSRNGVAVDALVPWSMQKLKGIIPHVASPVESIQAWLICLFPHFR